MSSKQRSSMSTTGGIRRRGCWRQPRSGLRRLWPVGHVLALTFTSSGPRTLRADLRELTAHHQLVRGRRMTRGRLLRSPIREWQRPSENAVAREERAEALRPPA